VEGITQSASTNLFFYLSHHNYVPSGPFDFVLGFSGIIVVPTVVVPHIVLFLNKVYVLRIDILKAFKEV
jgi:hypothetical protein